MFGVIVQEIVSCECLAVEFALSRIFLKVVYLQQVGDDNIEKLSEVSNKCDSNNK